MNVCMMLATAAVDDAAALGLSQTFLKIAVGFGVGLLVSVSYLLSARKDYSRNFAIMLVALPALVGAVILMVGSNVARAFSLAGIFSLVRFRSIPGDSKDIMTVFFAMTVGLAVGLGFYPEAFLITILVGVVVALISNIPVRKKATERQLRITIPENLNFEHVFDDILERFTMKNSLQMVKTSNMGTLFELTYVICMKEDASCKELMDEIRIRNGNLNVTICMVPEQKTNTTVL